MELTPNELIKQSVDGQNFTRRTQIMQAMKELFRHAIQQIMESELDVELGYEKSERMSESENDNLSKNFPRCQKIIRVLYLLYRLCGKGYENSLYQIFL